MKKSNNQKEMLFLIGHKSRTGIIMYICIIGLLLTIIGLFCPFCSYNPTVLSETKRNVGYTELSYIIIASSVLLIAAIIVFVCTIATLSKSTWKNKTGRYVALPVLTLVCVIVSFAFVTYACIFYQIPESSFDYLETQMEAGFYLFTVGSILFALAFLIFSLSLRSLAMGKTTLEKIAFGKVDFNENDSQENQ